MNQDDRTEAWSDCDTSDANPSSLNNSLSEEEFLIQSSAPGEVGLKFKISCLKKGNNNNEVHNSSGTNLIRCPSSTDTQSCQQDGNMENPLSSDATPKHPDICQSQAVENISEEAQSAADNSGLNAVLTESVKWNSQNASEVYAENIKDDHDEKTLKANSKCNVGINRSSIVDAPDACFRMDALPNVSPDSGIVSFEGSPFGNESPSSVTGMENSHEAHGTLTVPMDPQYSSNKCDESATMGKCDSNEASASKDSQEIPAARCWEKENSAQDVISGDRSPEREAGLSILDSQEKGKNVVADHSLPEDDGKNIPSNMECLPASDQHSQIELTKEQDSCNVMKGKDDLAVTSVLLSEDSPQELDTPGSSIILSSPSKISQPAWRKKRGKKQGKKKSLLLNHKKSTLYNVTEGKDSNKGSTKKEQVESGSNDVVESHVSTSDKVEAQAENAISNSGANCSDTQLPKKRSPGRPKGSLNRKVLDCFHRGTYRRPSTKLLEMETTLKATKTTSATVPPTEKRPRGRPRKCPDVSQSHVLLPQVKKGKIVKRRRARKRLFTRPKKTNILKNVPLNVDLTAKSPKTPLRNTEESSLPEDLSKSTPRASSLLPQLPTNLHVNPLKSHQKKVKDDQISDVSKVETHQRKVKDGQSSDVTKVETQQKKVKDGQISDVTKVETQQKKVKDGQITDVTKVETQQKKVKDGQNSDVTKGEAHQKKVKDGLNSDVTKVETVEKSVFTDRDLDALLESVNSSINKQFTQPDEDNNETISSLSFDNPFKSVQTPSFPQLTSSAEVGAITKLVKPKYKKPKLHVMMRKTKRRKKKKQQKQPVPSTTSTFGVASSEKRMSFFSSCVQPPKILASSRLNVFQSGTGVESNGAATPTECDQSDCMDKRLKRKRRLLNFKSKHKNIIDPVFAAELDYMVSGLHDLTISENSNDNFIKVRPGEMPLPTIFRVTKIDVSKRPKDRIFLPESVVVDAGKVVKPRKDLQTSETSLVKVSGKSARKKSSSDQASESKDQLSWSDTSDQCLPPKKRHRMVNIDSVVSEASPPVNSQEPNLIAGKDAPGLGDKRKGRKPKRTTGPETSKQGGTASKSVEQELTIDTSSCSGPCSSVGGQTPSPCLSRLSTRSSTIPSVSSLSPTGSCSFRSRYTSKNVLLACPTHSFNFTNQEDSFSCAECQLIRQSSAASPNNTHANPPLLQRSLSTQLSLEPVNSLEQMDSSSESSPCLRLSRTKESVIRRTPRKRCKSATYSPEESDPSPPRLEKSCASSIPTLDVDAEHSVPPEISPVKDLLSPQKRSTYRRPHPSAKSKAETFSSPEKLLGLTSNLRPSRQSSSKVAASNNENVCNRPDRSLQSPTSQSVISDSNDSDWQPLPLKFCTKRKLVEEFQAVLQSDSSESECSSASEAEDQEVSYPSIATHGAAGAQPPRKRYQRVGLFSDFYKDDEPRRRCETMVRCRDRLIYVKDEHEFGLMPLPIHIGHHYMRDVRDFRLPYEIWWQVVHQQLSKRLEPKVKFRTIKSNVYSDSKVNSRKVEHPMCNCKPSPGGGRGCLDDCLNRMIYTECSSTNCPIGADCANQRIQKHEWANGIEKFSTADRGFGVRVTKPVKTGQFLLEYLGEVISESEFRRRMMEEYSEECHHYALHLDCGTIIDGYRMGNIGRYVNHSCQPNCEMQKWNVNGLYRMVLFASRDIQPYEELVYDYNFDAFNQETQQECRCGSSECRGVIGGKAQRTNGLNRTEKVDDMKDKRKSRLMNKKAKEKKQSAEAMPVQPPTKPMTHKERCYARKHRMFLVRNVDKVRNQRHPGQVYSVPKEEVIPAGKVNCVTSDLLLANLSESSVKTRLAALAKDNPEVLRRHQLAQLFDKMLTELLSLKDEDGSGMVMPLMSLPSRKKQMEYYQVVKDPIDLSMIKQRVKTGYYDHLSSFNADVMLLFTNVELYCGHKSELGQVILKLRRIFNCVKQEMASQLDEKMGAGTTRMFMDCDLEKLEQAAIKNVKQPEEDIIRCICGVTRDEGLMLQCEKCMKWQHCDCVRASGEEEHYLCDRCEPRYYDPEIPLAPNSHESLPDCTHFMTLVKDDMQYAVGDCVYVMRDCKRTASGTPLRSSHRLMATTNPDSLDIFRIEQLWKDPKGERFASGTPYLRPQETFHEPTRKFFHNELFRTPNFEIIPMDLVMGKCIVLDPNTYSKGRPKGFKEQDVYICEYRVDKTAHLFHKIKEIWYPVNTSRFCFDWFEMKLSMKRTFIPHEVPEEYIRKTERCFTSGKDEPMDIPEKKHDVKKVGGKHQILHGKVKVDESLKHDVKLKAEVKVNVKKGGVLKKEMKQERGFEKTDITKLMDLKKQKRLRLERFLNRLLHNIPGKQKIDLSYLLDGGRRVRKKLVK